MNDQTIEQEIQAKGLTAPRVTPDDIEANIVAVDFVKHVSNSRQVLRWAVITVRNGFAVTGRPSVAVSPENDNAEIGNKVALDNAKSELWQLMGYELRSLLSNRVPSRLNVVVDTPVPLDESSRIEWQDVGTCGEQITINNHEDKCNEQ